MKKVNILLSAYNGEKYISAQLESLLAQTYPSIEIHVRDDGSSDKTVEIVREYLKYPNVKLYEGENLGFRGSFAWLLANCRDADYYAYCDQDDVWMPEKISRAVKALSKYDDIPAIYLGDFYWGDDQCRPQWQYKNADREHTLVKYITSGDMNTFGFTEVFNERCAAGIRDRKPLVKCAHDQVNYLYCKCKGKVIWDKKPTAYYRRHGDNASPQELVGGSRLTHTLWQVKTFLLQSGRDRVYEKYQEFYDVYSDVMDPKEKKIFLLYLNRGHNLKKALYRGKYRDKKTEELMIRALFLLGRV
jgi:glycosyltransferase involved in cell wall biosynthesis